MTTIPRELGERLVNVQHGDIKRKTEMYTEMYNELKPLVKDAEHKKRELLNNMLEFLEYSIEQPARGCFSMQAYEMIQRQENAKKFCEGKSSQQLQDYLAEQPVAYNSWKDADHDTLVILVLDVYDE